jgi:UDP-3-O-[3-hydroxymyristoyl] glucosamine N-acyltransferase
MITEKIVRLTKSPRFTDSWIVYSKIMQIFFKCCLKSYNYLLTQTPLFQRKITGSIGTDNSIHPTAIIDKDHVVIGNCCTIGKNVVLEKNTVIGNHVIIEEGAVIGSEGFEFRRVAGDLVPVVHTGGVIIHDNVWIGRSVCIDKSSLGDWTEIGEASHIHTSTHIGHGITIGRDTTLAEGTMIGGYAKIGSCIRIGRDSSLADGITLEDGVIVPDHTVVTRDIKKQTVKC